MVLGFGSEVLGFGTVAAAHEVGVAVGRAGQVGGVEQRLDFRAFPRVKLGVDRGLSGAQRRSAGRAEGGCHVRVKACEVEYSVHHATRRDAARRVRREELAEPRARRAAVAAAEVHDGPWRRARNVPGLHRIDDGRGVAKVPLNTQPGTIGEGLQTAL